MHDDLRNRAALGCSQGGPTFHPNDGQRNIDATLPQQFKCRQSLEMALAWFYRADHKKDWCCVMCASPDGRGGPRAVEIGTQVARDDTRCGRRYVFCKPVGGVCCDGCGNAD